jgi:hypothetical protein
MHNAYPKLVRSNLSLTTTMGIRNKWPKKTGGLESGLHVLPHTVLILAYESPFLFSHPHTDKLHPLKPLNWTRKSVIRKTSYLGRGFVD